MHKSVMLFLPVLLCANGCSENSTDQSKASVPIHSYPLELGNYWIYERTGGTYNYRPIDTAASFRPDTIMATDVVAITSITMLSAGGLSPVDSIRTLELECSEVATKPIPGSATGYQYMAMAGDGLYLHGFAEGGDHALPKVSGSSTRLALNGRTFSSYQQMLETLGMTILTPTGDGITREIPPLRAIEYPLMSGIEWLFRGAGNPFRVDKRVGSQTEIMVGGIAYMCYPVQWLYDVDNNGEWDQNLSLVDYIAPQGLIKRVLAIKDIVVSDNSHPNGIGVADTKDEFILTSTNVY